MATEIIQNNTFSWKRFPRVRISFQMTTQITPNDTFCWKRSPNRTYIIPNDHQNHIKRANFFRSFFVCLFGQKECRKLIICILYIYIWIRIWSILQMQKSFGIRIRNLMRLGLCTCFKNCTIFFVFGTWHIHFFSFGILPCRLDISTTNAGKSEKKTCKLFWLHIDTYLCKTNGLDLEK